MPDDDDQKPHAPELPEGSPSAVVDEVSGSASPPAEDRFRPEAIAARVDHVGEETELERIARQEEQKLLERKRMAKGKRGLEAAASKRLAKIGEGKVKRPSAASDAYVPEADPLLERARRFRNWVQGHRRAFGALVGAAVVTLAGALGWTYWQARG